MLFAPERIPGMIQSMLQDYDEVCLSPCMSTYKPEDNLALQGRLASDVEKHHWYGRLDRFLDG
jgi:hypothetical protein